MGIDIYLKWNSMSEGDKQSQYAGFSTTAGSAGYLRESYHGGPYATKILCREAFEAENCEAQIPASVLRERLTNVTEPVIGANAGHTLAAMFFALMKNAGATIEGSVMSDTTCPMTVEEAVRERYARLYPDEPPEHVEEVVQSYRDFVALAEKMEAENGEPCTIYASY